MLAGLGVEVRTCMCGLVVGVGWVEGGVAGFVICCYVDTPGFRTGAVLSRQQGAAGSSAVESVL